MKKSGSVVGILVLSLFLGLVTSCAPDTAGPDAAPTHSVILQVAARTTPTPAVTEAPVPLETPDDVPAVTQEITRILKENDMAQFSPLLFDAVWVGPDADASAGDSLSQADGLSWLTSHRGHQESVTAIDYVRDSALLRVTTTGWTALAPLKKGVVLFQLHRYDATGQESDVQGSWRIDTILYE